MVEAAFFAVDAALPAEADFFAVDAAFLAAGAGSFSAAAFSAGAFFAVEALLRAGAFLAAGASFSASAAGGVAERRVVHRGIGLLFWHYGSSFRIS